MKKTVLLLGCVLGILPMFAQNGLTGIWYSTWYVRNGAYLWHRGHGGGSSNQFLGDVNGDGKDDAVVFFSGGDWYVALSNGDGFNNYNQWTSGHGSGSENQFLGDVDGDGLDDAIIYNDGSWYVALSYGNGFGGYSQWRSGHGGGSANQFIADVNDDGKADAIAYFSGGGLAGNWYVALSEGNKFGGYSLWIDGHGSGSSNQFMADVNGDGRADAIVVFVTGGLAGNWYVALSNGNSFNGYSQWTSGHGSGSTLQTMGDCNNDGKADAVIYTSDGSWYVAHSTGSSFGGYSKWKEEHNKYNVAESIMIGNLDGKTDGWAIAYHNGVWHALPPNVDMPFYQNLWDFWDIYFLPYHNGKYQQYDSGDSIAIREHLQEISEAKIDYLLMDETNNLYVNRGVIFDRAIAVAKEIKKWNENPENRPMRYAFVCGGIQFSGNPTMIEYEAEQVWKNVINREGTGGLDTYLIQDGKPLLVFYYGEESYRQAWRNLDDHTWSDKFTIRWCNGSTTSEKDLYGWGLPNGSVYSSFLMSVMPGWYNHKGRFVSRENGSFYTTYCWNRVMSQMPEQVVINSYNEYAEETAVATANTDYLIDGSEEWAQPDMYWNTTVEYVAKYKKQKNCAVPTVDFSADKTHSDIPANFTFTSQVTDGINYQWDFGDGTYSIEPNPTHYYAQNGKYTVTLHVTGTGNTTSKVKEEYISVGSILAEITNVEEDDIAIHLIDRTLIIDSKQVVERVTLYDVMGRIVGVYTPIHNVVELHTLQVGVYVAVVNGKAQTITIVR